VPSRAWTLRTAALLGAGAFGVHQLRYVLSYDHGAARSLTLHGHGYLAPLGPVLAGVVVLALAAALGRVARGVVEPAPRFRRLWAGASGSLLAVYCAQESIERLLTGAHAGGVPGMFWHGGWVALPLAAAIGLAIALLMRGTAAATAVVAGSRPAPWRAPSPARPLHALLPPWAPGRTRAAARHLAARGPPPLSV
jgi:hypothetical protein